MRSNLRSKIEIWGENRWKSGENPTFGGQNHLKSGGQEIPKSEVSKKKDLFFWGQKSCFCGPHTKTSFSSTNNSYGCDKNVSHNLSVDRKKTVVGVSTSIDTWPTQTFRYSQKFSWRPIESWRHSESRLHFHKSDSQLRWVSWRRVAVAGVKAIRLFHVSRRARRGFFTAIAVGQQWLGVKERY